MKPDWKKMGGLLPAVVQNDADGKVLMVGYMDAAALAKTRKTIVFVTHSLVEAVFLADRIAVFTARPGRIKTILTVDEPHPRAPGFMTSAKLTGLRNALYELLHDEVRRAMETGAGV